MPDEIITELWEIKDQIAKEYNYDLRAYFEHLQAMERERGQEVVSLGARKIPSEPESDKGPKGSCG